MSEAIIQSIISGLAVGSMYALVAFGFSVTFTTTKTMNFAQGDFVSLGGLIAFGVLLVLQGKPPTTTVVNQVPLWQHAVGGFASIAMLGLMGVLMYYLALRPFMGKPGMSWVMSTIGFGVIMTSVGLAIWGPSIRAIEPPFGDGVIRIFGAGIRPQEIFMFAVASLVMLIFDWVMRRTAVGRAMRAVAFNPLHANLMGINVRAYMVGAFLISSALAGLAGVLIAPLASASLYLGFAIGLKGFSSAIVGGLDNARGCVAGGFLLGVLESLVGMWSSSWREVIVFAVVIIILGIKPAGLFSRQMVEKV